MAKKKQFKAQPRSRARAPTADVVIVGGGVMGCACAWALAKDRGLRVTVLERSVPGAEASTAAAGIVGAHAEASGPGPMTKLMIASQKRHADWAGALWDATGIDVAYRPNGILKVAYDRKGASALKRAAAWQTTKRLGTVPVDGRRIAALEPALRAAAGGVLFRRDGRIDPPLFFRALHIAAQRAGVEFRAGAYVRRVLIEAGRAHGVGLHDGRRIEAGAVVVAAGSWTTLVEGTSLGDRAVVPARGQIVELRTPRPVVERIVFGPRCYLVPRDDGRTLVGSTLEFVGYQRDVTAKAVRDLLSAAIELVPDLAEATVGAAWSSFRPYTEDELPVLGATSTERLFLATGHYRTGILLAPITAEAVSALVVGTRPPVRLAPFSANRV